MEVANPHVEKFSTPQGGGDVTVKADVPKEVSSPSPAAAASDEDNILPRDNQLSKDNKTYKMVAVSMDLTGKKPVDEIVQIGAFTVDGNEQKSFAQYIMPYRNVSRTASRLHGIRIFTNFGAYRVLKDIRTMKNLKTRSEYSTLRDFLEWLNVIKGTSDGIILIHHGNSVDNLMPFLVQALERYKMRNDFLEVVHGAINCKTISALLPELKDRSLSMRSLLRRVLKFDEDKLKTKILLSAKSRSKLTYRLFDKISKEMDIYESCTTKDLEIPIPKEPQTPKETSEEPAKA